MSTLMFVFTPHGAELQRRQFSGADIAACYSAFAAAVPVGTATLHYTESGPVAPLVQLG